MEGGTMGEFYDKKAREYSYRYFDRCAQFNFRLRKDKDGDIISFLRSQGSLVECIRKLVRAEILRQRGGVLELDKD